MDTKFTSFIKPYLSFIDNGDLYRKPFSWLYTVMAGLNILIPFYIFFMAIDNNLFDSKVMVIIVFILVWVIIAFASWISFQLWWDRKSKILDTSDEGDEFIATPVFSHLIQTLGEWLGTWVAIVGFGFALLTTIFLGDDAYYLSRQLGVNFLETGWLYIILMPVYGFLIIVTARFLAEQFRALTSIANSTKKR